MCTAHRRRMFPAFYGFPSITAYEYRIKMLVVIFVIRLGINTLNFKKWCIGWGHNVGVKFIYIIPQKDTTPGNTTVALSFEYRFVKQLLVILGSGSDREGYKPHLVINNSLHIQRGKTFV